MSNSIEGEAELRRWARQMREAVEPGMPHDNLGKPSSAGTCLLICVGAAFALKRFGMAQATVRGGSGEQGEGALATDGAWRGHYWLEVALKSGEVFVVCLTSDQFGYEPISVLPLYESRSRFVPGDQEAVDEAAREAKSQILAQ